MPSDDQRGRIPRSSSPGRPLRWKWPSAQLGILWGSDQPTAFDSYVEPNSDRLRKPISMPTVIRLNYDRTTYDTDPPVGFQYYGKSWEINPDFDVDAAAASLGLVAPPFGIILEFLNESDVYDLGTLGLVHWVGVPPPPSVPAYVSLSLPIDNDITSGDPGIVEPPPPLTLVQVSYARVLITDADNPDGVEYYSGPSNADEGNSLIGVPFTGPPL